MIDRDSELGGLEHAMRGLEDESNTFTPQGEHRRSETFIGWQRRLTEGFAGSTGTSHAAELITDDSIDGLDEEPAAPIEGQV